jgi:hypothetical protein
MTSVLLFRASTPPIVPRKGRQEGFNKSSFSPHLLYLLVD